MKVFELMSALSELPAGQDISVSVCITAKELVGGQEIDTGTYHLDLKIVEVYENSIGVEV